MSTKKVDDYAYKYNLSNNAAKRAMGSRRNAGDGAYSQAQARGTVAGVGSKGAKRRKSG